MRRFVLPLVLLLVLTIAPTRFNGTFATVRLHPGEKLTVLAQTNPTLEGQYVALLVHLVAQNANDVQIRLVDRSPRAIPGTLGLAMLSPYGKLLSPVNDHAILSETTGTQGAMKCLSNVYTAICHSSAIALTSTDADAVTQAAAIHISGPPGNRILAILYNGATLSRFSAATVTAQVLDRGVRQNAVINIVAEPTITPVAAVRGRGTAAAIAVSLRANDHTFGTGIPFGPFNDIDVSILNNQVEKSGYYPSIDNNVMYVGVGNSVEILTIDGQNAGFLDGPSPVSISALSLLALRDKTRVLFAADRNCTFCKKGNGIGIFAMLAEPTLGPMTPVEVARNDMDFTVANAGPLGLAAMSDMSEKQSAETSVYFAARNSIYRVTLNARSLAPPFQSDRRPELVAGSGIAGAQGTGEVNGLGAAARFNFEGATHIGMAFDALFSTPKALYIADPGNNAIRVLHTNTGVVSTYAALPGPPVGVALDPFSGSIFVSVPSLHAVYMIESTGVSRRVPGDALSALPMTSATVSGPWATANNGSFFENLPLTSRKAGPNSGDVLERPLGIAYDAQGGSILVLDDNDRVVQLLR